jgi:hydrogenase maturation protein HypF
MTGGRRIDVRGTVQGVGYRPWVYRLAHELGIVGRVRNDAAGVTIDAFGPTPALESFTDRLEHDGPPASSITSLRWRPITALPPPDFAIDASDSKGARRVSLPPDLATCDDCLAEILDPADRRFGYPFTNCTNCGPRYTIVRGVPYDRPATTMAAFTMCPACRAEYDDPRDRRFHAQPNACPACGPRLAVSIERAAEALARGAIVAVKGVGGFHLACDATDADAVARLRRRKRREAKPLAVMCGDLDAARRLALVSEAEAHLLVSSQRPIVLLPRRAGAPVAAGISDTPLLGLLLPYTPLHHLLLRAVGRPLVMTSGNVSDEPIVFDDREALARLGDIADLFVLHDRPIETRCDDSIARVIAGKPVVLRRARGWVPSPVPLPRRVHAPILAVGADLKNTFCLAVDDQAYLGPHVGDLEGIATLAALEEGVARFERLLGIRPEIVAHDLHPGYASTDWARRRPEAIRIAVQHHHAHVAAAMADAELDGPVLGFAWDGTGWGTDGTAWGGELLLADYARYQRLATFHPVLLPGGDKAVREPWRAALAALDDAFDGDTPIAHLPLFAGIPVHDLDVVRRMIAARIQTPAARGVGRWFDVFGAIGLGLPRAAYEGQIAIRWDLVADPHEAGAYPFYVDSDALPWEIDLRPALRRATQEVLAGRDAARISGRFHATLIAAADHVLALAIERYGRHPVVLTGGCFQNARLAEGIARKSGFRGHIYLHSNVPPGDGGIALGQALVADAQQRGAACV